MPRKKKIPNKRTNVPDKDWQSTAKDSSKYTRQVTFRMPHDMNVEWRHAIQQCNFTQTEVLLALMEGFIRNSHKINLELDKKLEELMEMKEYNERKAMRESVDEAIARLKRNS